MSFITLFTAGLAAFAPLVSAYTQPKGDPKGNAIYEPGLNSIVPVGKPFSITWEPDTKGKVSLVLLHGPSTNVIPIATIAESIENSGSYDWTPSTDLAPNKTYYGIELIVEGTGQYQYSTQFGISNPDYKADSSSSASASTASASTTMSVNMKAPLSSASASGTGAVASLSSSISSAIASASSSAVSKVSSASSAVAMSAAAASVSSNHTVLTSTAHTNGTLVAQSTGSVASSNLSSTAASMSTATRTASKSSSASGSSSASSSAAAQTGAAVKVGAGFGSLALAAGVVALAF